MKIQTLIIIGWLFIIAGVFIYFRTKDMTDLLLYILTANMYFIYADYKGK